MSLSRMNASNIWTHIMEADIMIGPVTLRDMAVESAEFKPQKQETPEQTE